MEHQSIYCISPCLHDHVYEGSSGIACVCTKHRVFISRTKRVNFQNVNMYICIYTCIYLYMYVYIYTYVYISIYISICIYIYIHICIYTHINVYSVENNRTVGRPKVDELIINSVIKWFIDLSKEENSELWFVEKKFYTISINRMEYLQGLSQKIRPAAHFVWTKICVFHQKSGLRRMLFIKKSSS